MQRTMVRDDWARPAINLYEVEDSSFFGNLAMANDVLLGIQVKVCLAKANV